jgi:hypothetical protein
LGDFVPIPCSQTPFVVNQSIKMIALYAVVSDSVDISRSTFTLDCAPNMRKYIKGAF